MTAERPALEHGKLRRLAGGGIFMLTLALYGLTMATSFVPGDSANYLSLAHTGALVDRGNGVPLYISLLNAAIRLPLPFDLSDGFRANLLTLLIAAGSVTASYAAALRATGSVVAALVGSTCVMISGLIWSSSSWIMPHISMVLIGAWFIALLVRYDQRPSRSTAAAMGLLCGVGFGMLPDAVLFLPVAVAYPILAFAGDRRWKDVGAAMIGAMSGIALNAALIFAHESISPVSASADHSVLWSTFFYLTGGHETQWVIENLTVVHALQGYFTLPAEIVADFEFFGSFLALVGLITGLRSKPRLHLALVVAFAIFSMWSGVLYPGDARMLHGIAVYPIAGVWAAMGAGVFLHAGMKRLQTTRFSLRPPVIRGGLGALLALLVLVNVAAGKFSYRDTFCSDQHWYRRGFCRERIPERVGDRYLQLAQSALSRVPEGAKVFGSAWDQSDQMNYLIQIRGLRPDLEPAEDLPQLTPEEFLTQSRPAWGQGRPVFLYGEWKQVERWRPDLLPLVKVVERGPNLFELLPATQGQDHR